MQRKGKSERVVYLTLEAHATAEVAKKPKVPDHLF